MIWNVLRPATIKICIIDSIPSQTNIVKSIQLYGKSKIQKIKPPLNFIGVTGFWSRPGKIFSKNLPKCDVYIINWNMKEWLTITFLVHDTVKNQIRIKNKIKAKFRSNGIKCSGTTVYLETHRDEWRKKLSSNSMTCLIVEELWVQMDQLRNSKEKLKKTIKIQSKRYSEIKKFMKIPGIGLIHGATISAIVETPHRFANKKKIWMYAGIGLTERSSGGTIYSRKLTREYNRPLKNAIKQSTEVAISARDNQFRRQFLKLTMEKGIASHRAKLTVARSILAALYGMWKKGEEYDSEIDKKRENKKFVRTI